MPIGLAVAAVGVVVVVLAAGARGGGSAGVVPVADAVAASPPTTRAAGPACPSGGCPRPVVEDGRVVRLEDTRYAVGEADDIVVLGDWDCDGLATVAVLRPPTGEVFVFDGYAEPGEDLVVGSRTRVSGAIGLEGADPDGDGCPALLAVGPGGQRLEIPT